MIGPVSGTGRAMMASLQQAIQKGMPPDQAIQYVKSMATQGVAPLTDLYAMMNQFQRLKQQPVQAPQTPPTIRDQLNMAEQQQAQQQMAMQQGLGGLPAPAMEQAQFAGGGIVAFGEGGDVREFFIKQKAIEFVKKGQAKEAVSLLRSEGIDPREVLGDRADILVPAPARTPVDERTRDFNLPANFGLEGAGFNKSVVKPESFGIATPSLENVEDSAAPPSDSGGGIGSSVSAAPSRRFASPAAPAVAAPEDISPEALIKRAGPAAEALAKWRESQGIGQADKEMATFLSDENNRLSEQFGRDRSLAFAEAGFKMAAAASRPGATFLGAFSEGAISGTQALRGLNKEMDANRRSMKEAMLKLRQSEEARKEGDFKTAIQMDQQYRTELFERKKHADAMAMDERRLQTTIKAAQISASARQGSGDRGGLTSNQAIDNRLGVLNSRAASLQGAMAAYDKRLSDGYDITPAQTEAYNRAMQELRSLEKERDQLTLSGSAPSMAPAVGEVKDGYRFKGGNPAEPNSWEKVGS